MAHKRKYGRHKKKNIYGTKPQFMSKSRKQKRYNQISTNTMWFASTGQIVRGPDGRSGSLWSPMNNILFAGGRLQLPHYAQLGDFQAASTFYTGYKILAFQIRLFAANVGTEPGPTLGLSMYNRGNTIVYTVNNALPAQAYSGDIQDLITKGSARMIPSRLDQYKRTMFRPKGFPSWGNCDTSVPIADRIGDRWRGQVVLQGQNSGTLDPATMWFWTMRTKVVFRGRRLSIASP